MLIQANGAGEKLTLNGNNGASIDGVTDGAIILLEVPSLDNVVGIGDGGNIFIDAGADGNAVMTGSQVIANGSTTFQNASSLGAQTMETLTNSARLDPANSSYPQLTNADVPEIRTASRFLINPAIGGTEIDSLFTNDSEPNPDGRKIWIQNIGVDDVALPNQSPSGTDGGKFFWAGDFTLPGGMGVSILFDASVGAGSWLIQGMS